MTMQLTTTISTRRAIQIAQWFMSPAECDRPLSKLGHGMSLTLEDFQELPDIIDRNILELTMIRPIGDTPEAIINDDNVDYLLDLRLWVTDSIKFYSVE